MEHGYFKEESTVKKRKDSLDEVPEDDNENENKSMESDD